MLIMYVMNFQGRPILYSLAQCYLTIELFSHAYKVSHVTNALYNTLWKATLNQYRISSASKRHEPQLPIC